MSPSPKLTVSKHFTIHTFSLKCTWRWSLRLLIKRNGLLWLSPSSPFANKTFASNLDILYFTHTAHSRFFPRALSIFIAWRKIRLIGYIDFILGRAVGGPLGLPSLAYSFPMRHVNLVKRWCVYTYSSRESSDGASPSLLHDVGKSS